MGEEEGEIEEGLAMVEEVGCPGEVLGRGESGGAGGVEGGGELGDVGGDGGEGGKPG